MTIKNKSNEKGSTLGIIGVCLGWLIPIIGIILGIISLARKEKSVALGIISIIESIIFTFIWFAFAV